MKNRILLLFAILPLFCVTSIEAQRNCEWDAWFKYPKAEAHFQKGKAVYVRVDPKKYQDLSYIDLYVDGKFIRKETNYPYEWAKGSSGDNYLRNLSCGKHHLRAKIVDKCRGTHYKEIYIYVDCNGNTGGNGNCQWDAWFKYPQNNKHFQKGKPVYVRVDPKKYQDIAYIEMYLDGKFIRKETSYPYEWAKGNGNSDNYLRNLKCGKHQLKAKIVDKCGSTHYKEIYFYVDCEGNTGGSNDQCIGPKQNINCTTQYDPVCGCDGKTYDNACYAQAMGVKSWTKGPCGGKTCEWDAWYKYPKNNGHYQKGKPVYVRVDPKKYQDIAYLELYVDGKFIRKETNYPYEWAKGSGNSDSYLRNLKCGKHQLKTKIVDKCGGTHYKEIYFFIDCDGNTGGNGNCQWDAWFKYPKNNGHYRRGKPVYVRVDPKKYQDIAYLELYVDGKFIRKETSYPYEWCKGGGNSDSYLRNLKCGKHHIRAKIVDKCGGTHYKELYVYIDC